VKRRTRTILAWIVVCAAFVCPAEAQPRDADRVARRDLSADEAMGGHTLARHVGRTDAQLAERLRRERQISAASTYTDRAIAERAVGAALASAGMTLSDWEGRSGRRPNLVLHYTERGGTPLGRSLTRGQSRPVPASRALVVLRWDERASRYYVLTSYPEADAKD
jgi:hypothetical protein